MIRYFIGSDDDGHTYLIPLCLKDEFESWLEWGYEMWSPNSPNHLKMPDWTGVDFDKFIIAGGFLTFMNPEINSIPYEKL